MNKERSNINLKSVTALANFNESLQNRVLNFQSFEAKMPNLASKVSDLPKVKTKRKTLWLIWGKNNN